MLDCQAAIQILAGARGDSAAQWRQQNRGAERSAAHIYMLLPNAAITSDQPMCGVHGFGQGSERSSEQLIGHWTHDHKSSSFSGAGLTPNNHVTKARWLFGVRPAPLKLLLL